jgi:hypothetical protein
MAPGADANHARNKCTPTRDGDKVSRSRPARSSSPSSARAGARADDLAAWAEAVGEMSGFGDAAHRERYVHQGWRSRRG